MQYISDGKRKTSATQTGRIIMMVKVVVGKILYFTVVTRLAFSVRAGLLKSARLSGRTDNLHKRIFYFALIPLFSGALFSIHEILEIINPFLKEKLDSQTEFTIRSVTLAFGFASSCVGYITLFPNMRKAFLCKV